MSIKPIKVQFNGGELSPWLEGRMDVDKYNHTAKFCRNFIPIAEGSLRRRGGTHFVAFTPEDDELVVTITVDPVDAVIVLNNQITNTLTVSRGDVITYYISADGYISKSGNITITESTTYKISLVATKDTCLFYIIPTPDDASVVINGYLRNYVTVAKNEIVNYWVYKNGYILVKDQKQIVDTEYLYLTLEAEEGSSANFAGWGDLVKFSACSAVGSYSQQLKCFMIEFTNGYLPIVFDTSLVAPESVDESLFSYDTNDGYNSVALVSGEYVNTILTIGDNENVYYRDIDGTLIFNSTLSLRVQFGWQKDENGNYVYLYDNYDAVISNNMLSVYYNGEIVFELRGRENG